MTRSMLGEAVRQAGPAEGRLGDLYARHLLGALRLAYLVTGDRALGEDLVHDAFLRVFGRFDDLRDPGAFEACLKRTVVNLARKHLRRGKIERAYLASQNTLRNLRAEDPDVSVSKSLWDALMTLPERQRAAIVLRFYEDLSELQTAEILRCRPGTVKSLVSRGMQALRIVVDTEDELA
jgi:RNA polymerase sigma-70 factor (sigma-E family)